MVAAPALAASSTSRGQISVAQVMEMLNKAPADPVARQVLVAYLAGVGESAGVLIDAATVRDGATIASCKTSLKLDDASARRALETASASRNRAEIAATPLILRDMVSRAGCTLK